MMQRVSDKTSYANALDIYLNRINCDVLTLEVKDRGMAELELLGNWKGKTKGNLARCRIAPHAQCRYSH